MDLFFPAVSTTLFAMNIGRLVLMIISCFRPKVCKFFIYYQTVFAMLEWSLPREYGSFASHIVISENVLNFCFFAYDYWLSAIAMTFVKLA